MVEVKECHQMSGLSRVERMHLASIEDVCE